MNIFLFFISILGFAFVVYESKRSKDIVSLYFLQGIIAVVIISFIKRWLEPYFSHNMSYLVAIVLGALFISAPIHFLVKKYLLNYYPFERRSKKEQ